MNVSKSTAIAVKTIKFILDLFMSISLYVLICLTFSLKFVMILSFPTFDTYAIAVSSNRVLAFMNINVANVCIYCNTYDDKCSLATILN